MIKKFNQFLIERKTLGFTDVSRGDIESAYDKIDADKIIDFFGTDELIFLDDSDPDMKETIDIYNLIWREIDKRMPQYYTHNTYTEDGDSWSFDFYRKPFPGPEKLLRISKLRKGGETSWGNFYQMFFLTKEDLDKLIHVNRGKLTGKKFGL
jgi:hypothetical protein